MNDRPAASLTTRLAPLQAAWIRLAPRERRAVVAAATVLGLALLWWVGIAPALSTLRQSPAQQQQLDAQLAHMRSLAARAQTLRQEGKTQVLGREATQRALEQAGSALPGGTVQLVVQGDRANVTLRGAAPDALARWLEQVRINARLVPVQADLQRSAEPAGWTGQLVLAGPGLGADN